MKDKEMLQLGISRDRAPDRHSAVKLCEVRRGLHVDFSSPRIQEHHTIQCPKRTYCRLENFLDEARTHRPGAYAQTRPST